MTWLLWIAALAAAGAAVGILLGVGLIKLATTWADRGRPR